MSDERFGRYRLVRRIGAGGMAEVFRAELVGAEGVTRELVVKKIHPTLSLDPEAVAMFVEEARVAARLHHPNVVQVYEFGRAGDGYFLAMELVDGCDLAALLRGERLPDGALAWAFSELLAGLGYVHALRDAAGRPLGLVHRDVSPHNVLVGAAGEVKLADFGIATVSARVAPDESVKGKYAYMAPEQARGEPVDARSDLFAVGAMLYEALAGRRMHPARPDDGRVPEAVRAGRVDAITAVAPGVHPALAAVVTRAVAPSADDRFADARSFREALTAAFVAAGARPDREALQGLVTRRLEGVRGAATSAPDRTLTAQGDPLADDRSAPNDPGDESIDAASEKGPARSLEGVRSPSRRVVERVGIAVGIFTLAVLTERKTRPVRPNPAVVRVALPDDPAVLRWFARAPKAAAEQACRCRVEVRAWRSATELAGWMRAGGADLAAVTSTVFPALVGAGVVASREGAGAGALRPEVARAVVEAGLVEGGRMVPAAVDVVVLAWRSDAARDAALRVTAQRAALETALVERTGVGAPARFAYERDPAYWTWWDLLAAAHAWRSVDGVARVGVSDALPVWIARTAVAGAAEGRSVRTWSNDREAWVEALGWESALASMNEAVAIDDAPSNDRAVAALYAVVAQARTLVGRGARWELGAVPRGDSGLLDAGSEGRRLGGSGRVGEVLGWVTAAPTDGAATRRAFAAVTTPPMRDALASAWRALPARADGELSDDPALRGQLAQEEAVLRGGPFALASAGLTLAEVAQASRALGALRRQARTGGPTGFVGGGRWRTATMRAAVGDAFEVRTDGGL